ncbi:MAG TPA: geranyl transferase, partial [Ruminococcus flavefaciens]|nr:geranyl transferase [Ruminococcus flavefaciens]
MKNFNEKLAEYIERTEANLKKYNAMSEDMLPQKSLIDAMNYSLEAGGKRVRPALVYGFCEALGGDLR